MQKFSKAERVFVALYLVWFFVHVGLFFYAEESSFSSKFWPFTSGKQSLEETYDITEFLVYAVSPLILFIAFRLIFARDPDAYTSQHKHIEMSFLPALLNEKIKAETLEQKINELTNQPVSFNYLNELKLDKEKLDKKGIKDWIDRKEVKEKYKGFE